MRKATAMAARSRDDKTLNSYRDLCETRLRRLERYKKARSICELGDQRASTSASCHNLTLPVADSSHEEDDEEGRAVSVSSSDASSSDAIILPKTPFELLREKMIGLMENDVELMKKLLNLATSIQELREKQPSAADSPLPRSPSRTSMSSEEDEEDEWRPMGERQKLSASVSAITHLYVDEEEDETLKELENRPKQQFFSRKNSVLRIPIPPRASNRMLGRRIPRRPSEITRNTADVRAPPLSPTAEDIPPTCCGDRHCRQPDSRDSEASIDSGIRDDEIDVVHA
ncbi:hypothetical protein M3Y99_00200900 [Aphelenchoides fujianensis]|nr:hypothetical protein M3Y99_00200900 [Aphelenchoides fujianensis]